MAEGKYIAYFRVSTKRQGDSGLGLEAQHAAVLSYLNGGSWKLIREPFIEVESGKNNDRPKLAEALECCRLTGATLLIAKLDRLSRNASFLLSLRDAGVDFVAVDMPNANRLTVGIMAVVAEAEREMISTRTKAALAAAKTRREALGMPTLGGHRAGEKDRARAMQARGAEAVAKRADTRAAQLAPVIEAIKASGVVTARGIADQLQKDGIKTPRGGKWSHVQVRNVLARLADLA